MLNGLSEEEARSKFWILDDKGLLGNDRRTEFRNQKEWIRDEFDDKISLEEVVEQVKPTVIIGLTGVGGLFTEKAIKTMSAHCERPIIFPLSNPTDKAECTAENAYRWSKGKCIYASGSPFEPVEYDGITHLPAQSNNMYTYPGLGLGALAGDCKHITDSMLNAAAIALVDSTTEEHHKQGRIFPRVREIPALSKNVALAVAQQAYKDRVVNYVYKKDDEELMTLINDRYWDPKYGSILRIDQTAY
jgi:malate dehydrogenase (oxaloacetate-decarboxylating)(NADP+)